MANPLLPELTGTKISVELALNTPRLIAQRVAELSGGDLLVDKFFNPGPAVESGALLFVRMKASDKFTENDVEARSVGSEYVVVRGVDPEPKLAPVTNYGGKFPVPDEVKIRNQRSYLDTHITQLSNTITRKVNAAALAAVEDVIDNEQVVAGHPWNGLVFVGPENTLTPSDARPSADLSAAQLASDLQELGVKHDLLIVHPMEAHELRSAYGENLAKMLESAGVEMVVSGRVMPGEAYVLEKGGLGKVGFEKPLTIETWDDRSTHSTWVQGFAVPAFATENPGAVKKLIGLAA